jgi:hypothetical protein
VTEQEREHRLAFALALRMIADKVCDNDDWPVEVYPQITVCAARADEGGVEEVDRAAAAMGVEPEWNEARTHYTATVMVGPITCSTVAITSGHMKDYKASTKVANEWIEQQRITDA